MFKTFLFTTLSLFFFFFTTQSWDDQPNVKNYVFFIRHRTVEETMVGLSVPSHLILIHPWSLGSISATFLGNQHLQIGPHQGLLVQSPDGSLCRLLAGILSIPTLFSFHQVSLNEVAKSTKYVGENMRGRVLPAVLAHKEEPLLTLGSTGCQRLRWRKLPREHAWVKRVGGSRSHPNRSSIT